MNLTECINELVHAASQFTGLAFADIAGTRRLMELVQARQAVWHCLQTEYGFAPAEIARAWYFDIDRNGLGRSIQACQDRIDQRHRPTLSLARRLAEVLHDLDSEYIGPPGTVAPPAKEVYIVINAWQ